MLRYYSRLQFDGSFSKKRTQYFVFAHGAPGGTGMYQCFFPGINATYLNDVTTLSSQAKCSVHMRSAPRDSQIHPHGNQCRKRLPSTQRATVSNRTLGIITSTNEGGRSSTVTSV